MNRKMLLLAVFVLMATAAFGDDHTYFFRELKHMTGGGYLYDISEKGSAGTFGSCLEDETVAFIAKFMGVADASDILGRFIVLPGPDPESIEWWVFSKEHPNYKSPTDQWIRTRAAEALAKGEEPDYRGIWRGDVASAFYNVFFIRANETWTKLFSREIEQISQGKAKLRLATTAEVDSFAYRVRGPGDYFILSSEGRDRKVFIGPYATPVNFPK